MLNDNLTAIIVAILSGLIPGSLALAQSRRTKKSVELAGSNVTVQNWNKLIKNLYENIDFLQNENKREHDRAERREAELLAEIEATKQKAATEKQELLAEITLLKQQILQLEQRVTAILIDDDKAHNNTTN